MSDLLLQEQAWWDQRVFDRPDGYKELSTKNQKILHIKIHVAKAALKWLRAGQEREIAADLAIYRSQLMNECDIDTSDIQLNVPDSNALSPFIRIVIADGELAYYLEPMQHDGNEHVESTHVFNAINQLHLAASGISQSFGFDLESIHRERMESLLGEPLPNPLVQ